MKLIHGKYSFCIDFTDEKVNSLIVENNCAFTEMVSCLYEQTQGENGDFVLSEDNIPITISKNAELLTQFIPFDCNRKNLITKLYNLLKKEAMSSELYCDTQRISSEIVCYIEKLLDRISLATEPLSEPELPALFKAVDLKLGSSDGTIGEKLLEYFNACYELEGEKLFVTVNLKSYFDDKQLQDFISSVVSHKIRLLMLENNFRKAVEGEKVIIIDNDLCEIY